MANNMNTSNDIEMEGNPGLWKDEDTVNNFFNEMVELKSSFRAVKRSVFALIGLVFALLLSSFGVSLAILKHSKGVSVDENTSRMMTKSGNTAATIGLGQSFQLPIFSFQPFEPNIDPNASAAPARPNPFVCVGVESVVDMWRSVQFGVHTNAVIMGVYDGKTTDDYGSEFGVILSYQGSVQNRTVSPLLLVLFYLRF